MSALPPEADMFVVGINVCYVPIADIARHRRTRLWSGPAQHRGYLLVGLSIHGRVRATDADDA